ncbi:kinase [Lentzea sp. NBRC 105346]|uniref:serine/threonine-protein kinase n=1 Tax=Lentzea sp. NBRC 105346 TaxID=3032205 RepID=UPI0024A49B81|nr:serine/threonine-protein kinase [Lentzea sp. NBRC 105346]GLZ31718.1 kinase [Lentzea sp. NBRC 105346]
MTEELPEIPGFRYVRPLGKNVHLYRDNQHEVAVKLLVDPPRVAEIKTVLGLKHPEIVEVHRAGRTRLGLLYLVMKHYERGDLAALAPLPVDRVLQIGVEIAGALQAAHDVGIAHRDVKPANILMDEVGNVCLTDFGVLGRDRLPWTAPEVISNGHHGVPADIFSLGATLWHLVVGHSPFVVPHGNNTRAVLEQRILHGSPRPTGRAPRSFEELLRQAMALDPAARPASAKEFVARLREIQRETGPVEEVSAAEVVHVGPPAPKKKSRWPLYAGVGAVAAGVIVTSVILLPGNKTLPPAATSTNVQPQNAGSQSALPGRANVVAMRIDANTLRFTWTYKSQLPNDSFVWRTNDELKTGTVDAPQVDLYAPGALCVEVKVVRADGSNATSDDWSPEGCGS